MKDGVVLKRTMVQIWARWLIVAGVFLTLGILVIFAGVSEQVSEEGYDDFEEVAFGKSGSFETDDPPRRWIHVFADEWFSCDSESKALYVIEFSLEDSNGTSVVPEDYVCNNQNEDWLVMSIKMNYSGDTYTYESTTMVSIVAADISASEVSEIQETASVIAGIGCWIMCFSIPMFIIGTISGLKGRKGEEVVLSQTPVVANQRNSKGYRKTSTGFYMPSPPPKEAEQPTSSTEEQTVQGDEAASNGQEMSTPWANLEDINE